MPEIPTAIDYGGRPSLQTGRVDRPSGANIKTADALVSAANTFQQVVSEKKAKEDRLNYSLARNEIQKADLESRAELSEDQDWASHDERYSGSFSTKRDEILSRYQLSPSDKEIMISESDLIHAQGRVAVGEGARRKEVDQAKGRYEAGKAFARASLVGVDGPTRNNIVLGQLDVIEAQVEAGYMSAEEGAIERQNMTQDFALSTVEAMAVDERIRVLERTLKYRKGYGASLGQHSSAILSASDDTGLPPELIAAVIQQESSGNADAVSPAGAVGLMQLREEAAKEMGVDDRNDPEQNVAGGSAYLAKQFARFDGDPEKALAAYNWGPANLKKAIAEHGDDWLAHAPAETQNYVAKLAPAWVGGGGDKEQMESSGKYKSGEGPLTADDIRGGLGTGSIADFLHADTAAKMLDQAYKGDKANQDAISAQAVVDAATTMFPEDELAMLKYVRDNTKGSVQNAAMTYARQLSADKARVTEAAEVAYVNAAGKEIRDGNTNLAEVKATDEYQKMSKPRQDALAEIQRQADHDEQYARQTQWLDRGDGGYSVEMYENLPTYGDPPLITKTNVDLTDDNWRAVLDLETSNNMIANQKILQAQEDAPITSHGQKPAAMVKDALEGASWQGRTDLDADEKAGISARLKTALTARIAIKQASFTPNRELTPEEANYELNQLMQQTALLDPGWIGTHGIRWGSGKDERKSIATMTSKEIAQAYVMTSASKAQMTTLGGGDKTMYQYLKQEAKRYGNATPTDEQIGRAHFALKANLTDEEYIRRLTED